jgi:hypothetical protein
MTLFHLFPENLSCCPRENPGVSAPDAGIPPVYYLFYQEAWGGPTGASLLSRRR